MTVTAITDFIN